MIFHRFRQYLMQKRTHVSYPDLELGKKFRNQVQVPSSCYRSVIDTITDNLGAVTNVESFKKNVLSLSLNSVPHMKCSHLWEIIFCPLPKVECWFSAIGSTVSFP